MLGCPVLFEGVKLVLVEGVLVLLGLLVKLGVLALLTASFFLVLVVLFGLFKIRMSWRLSVNVLVVE